MAGSRWYVLQTFSGFEGVVVDQVRGIIEWSGCFFPTAERVGARGAKRAFPHFPGYLFVRLDLELTPYWETINTVRGAVHLLPRACEKPTPLPVGFVEELIMLHRAGTLDEAADEVVEAYVRDEMLMVESGAWQGHVGRFLGRRRGQLELLVALLGRETVLPIPPHQVSRVTTAGLDERDRTTTTRTARSTQFGRRWGERPRPEAEQCA